MIEEEATQVPPVCKVTVAVIEYVPAIAYVFTASTVLLTLLPSPNVQSATGLGETEILSKPQLSKSEPEELN